MNRTTRIIAAYLFIKSLLYLFRKPWGRFILLTFLFAAIYEFIFSDILRFGKDNPSLWWICAALSSLAVFNF